MVVLTLDFTQAVLLALCPTAAELLFSSFLQALLSVA